MVLETAIRDNDSTRFAVDFGTVTSAELGDLPAKLGEHKDILPGDQPLTVHVFVPSHLPAEERADFINDVQNQMRLQSPKANFVVQQFIIDVEQARQDMERANSRIDQVANEIFTQDQADLRPMAKGLMQVNVKKWNELKVWQRGMKDHVAAFREWRHTKFTMDKDKGYGFLIGVARAGASVAVWFGAQQIGVPMLAQMSASVFLDIAFSVYEKEIDVFKGTHRLPGENIPYLGRAVIFYNERPLLKSWIVGNLIGFVASSYFRFWSWVDNPERTSAPWSGDALSTFGGAWLIGNIPAAFGAQGPRILRKKGYITSRTEYYIYSSYGAIFQLGGWFYGLGWNWPVIALTTAESTAKVGMYLYAYKKPLKEARAIALHPAWSERDVEELLYRVGYHPAELHSPDTPHFTALVERLKAEQNLTWKQKVAARLKELKDSCTEMLSKKSSDEPTE